jgi:pimeloyl-ACP methyl ester carboxylesterase
MNCRKRESSAFWLKLKEMLKMKLSLFAAVLMFGVVWADAPAELPEGVVEIEFKSTFDGTMQPALFFVPPQSEKPLPLLVGLHTWNATYKPINRSYLAFCQKNNWAMIYPNFRGANRNPEACASEAAVRDILDAIEYARRTVPINNDRIYLIGYSGGGHMSLIMAGRHPEIWAGVCCSVPISDLAAWHGESLKRRSSYWRAIEQITGGIPGASDKVDQEYRARSPMTYLPDVRGKVHVDILAGINDGHNGSVPISQALNAFNALAGEKDRLSPEQIELMTAEKKVAPELAGEWSDPGYGRRKIHFRRHSENVRISIFEGGHEALPNVMLNWLSRQEKNKKVDFSVPGVIKNKIAEDTHVTD